MLWTTRVRETVTRHVPYGSLFRRFFLLCLEYTFTVDLHRELRGSPVTSSQCCSISRCRSEWSAKRLQVIRICSSGISKQILKKVTKRRTISGSELTNRAVL